jgi:hypothetical protein
MARREVRLAILGDSGKDVFTADSDFFMTDRDEGFFSHLKFSS